MAQFKDAWTAHQLKRWIRPAAHHFVRPDWRRYVRPGFERDFPFELYERKYSPDQPRVPAGDPAGGQWTSGDGPETGGAQMQIAARISPAREAECEIMRRKDEFICKAFKSESCYGQAMLRYSNCLQGRPIPPLNF